MLRASKASEAREDRDMAAGDPGTRTAPLFTAPVTRRMITLHLIDRSGDTWAESLIVGVAATAASIEAWAAAYAACSQASLFMITDAQIREGAKASSNANFDQRNQVSQGINLLLRNPSTNLSLNPRVVAPVLAAMQGDQDIPIVDADPVEALISAIAALQATYNFQSAQYTDRRERKNNPRVSA